MREILVWGTIAAGLVIVVGVTTLTAMYVYYTVKKDRAARKAREEREKWRGKNTIPRDM